MSAPINILELEALTNHTISMKSTNINEECTILT